MLWTPMVPFILGDEFLVGQCATSEPDNDRVYLVNDIPVHAGCVGPRECLHLGGSGALGEQLVERTHVGALDQGPEGLDAVGMGHAAHEFAC